jgi:hypothetical protein
MLGAYDNREGMYYLDDLVGEDHNTAYFSPQGSPQVTYYLYYTAGLRSYVNITRVKGTYIEGSYFVRLSLMGNSSGPFINVEGTFKGNCRVLG